MKENQVASYRVLLEGGEGEIVEKKSRFIATFRYVESEEEAIAFIEEIKKKYWDARHNCSAFVIGSRAELPDAVMMGNPVVPLVVLCWRCFWEKVSATWL